jgi:acyl transferase domain-containing protein
MERKKDGVEAFSSCLGYIWSHFGSDAIDLSNLYRNLFGVTSAKDLSKDLPFYAWDHSRSYRKESRTLRTWLEAERPHLLLGKKLSHSSPSSAQWQNFIRQRDIEWLDGHSLQGQTVFPGAGYVVMAMEAAVKVAGDREIQLLEILDLKIDKAVTFEDENSLIELNLSLSIDSLRTTNLHAIYNFTINSSLAKENGLSRSAAGTVIVTFGPESLETLPPPEGEPPHLNNVSIERFYNMLHEIGYGYTKQFRGIADLRRGDGKACGTINNHLLEDNQRNMVIHPITLDVAFQSFIGAYTAPGDRRLRSILVPTGCDRIAINPCVSNQGYIPSSQLNFSSRSSADVGVAVSGDIEVFDAETNTTLVHVEGLCFKPFAPPSALDDHEMFSKWTWGSIAPDDLLDDKIYHATEKDKESVSAIERITYWYIKYFLSQVTAEDREKAVFHFKKQIEWCEYIIKETEAGRNVWYTSDWENDSRADIDELILR